VLAAVIRGLHAVMLSKACRPCWQRESEREQKTEKEDITEKTRKNSYGMGGHKGQE